MRLWNFSPLITVFLDIIVWLCLHILIAYGATLLPIKCFHENQWIYHLRFLERSGNVYKRLFAVKQWKKYLPDGGGWFKNGFSKKKLASRGKTYLDRFVKETCRGELTHWIVILLSPIFFLWNFTFVGFIMIGYALLSNFPCIIVQRYNRSILVRLRDRMMRIDRNNNRRY